MEENYYIQRVHFFLTKYQLIKQYKEVFCAVKEDSVFLADMFINV